jgi:hypothetical protein
LAGGFLVGALGVILVANVGVVVAEKRLPKVDDDYDVHARDVVGDMNRLRAPGVRSDAALVRHLADGSRWRTPGHGARARLEAHPQRGAARGVALVVWSGRPPQPFISFQF